MLASLLQCQLIVCDVHFGSQCHTHSMLTCRDVAADESPAAVINKKGLFAKDCEYAKQAYAGFTGR